jgi:hypothetical protein
MVNKNMRGTKIHPTPTYMGGVKTLYLASVFVKFETRGTRNLHEHLQGVASTNGVMGMGFPFEPSCTMATD